ATLTFPTGTSSNPTIVDTLRPTIRWNQTDPDAGAIFEYFEVEITTNTGIVSSGQHYQHTTLTTGNWMVNRDLPEGITMPVRVRVLDNMGEWSNWSATRYMKVVTNKPP